jgi:GNAT superfamily N-acetyltransferase
VRTTPVANYEIKLAETREEIARCFPVMLHLRTSLVEDEFVERIEVQQAQGYKLAYLEIEDQGGTVVAVAGFRIRDLLASGLTLYVDDLVTDPAQRSKGWGKAMLDWLQSYALAAGCETFSLDSGTHRHEAHAFYFREGMHVTSFHFARKL